MPENLTSATNTLGGLGHEFKTAIGTGQRSLQARMEKAVGFDDDHAGSAIRMAIVQPEQRHGSLWPFPQLLPYR